MKKKKEHIPSRTGNKEKLNNKFVVIGSNLMLLVMTISLLSYYVYDINRRKMIYQSLDIQFSSVKEIEYGTANYNPMDLVENINDGTIINYTEVVDTKSEGKQEVVFEVSKEDIVKEIKVEVEVVDSKAPEIELKEDKVTIMEDQEYDLLENIESIVDVADGDIPFVEKEEDIPEDGPYYLVKSNLNSVNPGEYKVDITAVDSKGNSSDQEYTVVVNEKPRPVVVPVVRNTTTNTNTNTVTYTEPVYDTTSYVPSGVDTSSVVSAAYSFIGYRYVYGGSSPATGFDCSGFTAYLYSLVGKNISHGVGGQAVTGYAVSRADMQPGDIIIWSGNGYSPTHAALYVGNDTMIHAANPRRGVIIGSVSYWESHGGGSIYTIRRV